MNGTCVRANRAGRTVAAAGRAGASRRGVALMLAMVALGTATILTTAYVVSRSNSSGMAANAMDMSQASWSAESGAEIALAVLETEAAWESDADPATLLSGFALTGGEVTVLVTDVNGDAPTADTRDLVMTIIAESGGVRSVKQRMVHRRPEVPVQEAADGWLREFAAFGQNALLIQDGVTIAPWKLGPGMLSGGRAKIGTGFNSSGSLYIGAGSLVNVGLYTDATASVALKGALGDARLSESFAMPLDTPAAPARMPATLRSLVSGVLALIIPPPDVAVGAGESHVSAAGAYNKVDVNGDDAALTLDATGGREFTFAEIKVASNGTLRISGDARIHVQGRLEITNGGTIEFADAGSRAVFFTADDVVIADAGAGVPSSVARIADRDAADLSQYSAPSRLVIAPLPVADGGKAAPFVQIDNGSLVVANIHAPTAVVTVTNGATLIGRATGGTFAMATGTTLLYDCMLDHRNGFSESDGPLYKADGTPIDGLASALGSFNSLLGPDALVGHLIGSMPVEFDLGEESIALGGGPVITPRARGRVEASPWPTIVRGMEETGGTSGGGGNAPPPGLLVEWNDENLYCFEPRTTNEDVDDDDTDAQVWVDDDGVGKSGTQIMQEPF